MLGPTTPGCFGRFRIGNKFSGGLRKGDLVGPSQWALVTSLFLDCPRSLQEAIRDFLQFGV